MKSVLAWLAAALAAGCAHAPGAAPAPSEPRPADLFPLAVGNEWVYLDRSPALPPGTGAPERRVRIMGRTADGFFRDSERSELRADPDCVRDRARRLLCAPVRPGNAWVSVTGVSATERYEIVAVDERVEVPAGVFTGCVRVRAHVRASAEAESVLELTYARGVGPVRMETFAVVGGTAVPQVRAELKSYAVAR